MIRKASIMVLSVVMLAASAFAARPEKLDGVYYVAFKASANASDRAMLKSHGVATRGEFPELRVIEIGTTNPMALQAIANSNRVEYVEEVPMRYKSDLSSQQLAASSSNGLYGLITSRATVAHARGITGSGIKVGVADTQLDISHPDIAGNLLASTDCVTKNPCSGSGWQNDGETHATHVSGTIVGVFNTTGVYGAAYNAKLLHARVLGPSGGSTSDIMRGVTWLADNGAKVVNLSLGGGLKSKTEENFYKNMRTRGVIVCAATGNDGARSVSFPAGYDVNISVGAVDKNDAHADFSNTGRGIDVSAPGVLVLSSVPAGTGHEASVTNNAIERTAFGLEFAGATTGLTANMVHCGLGNPGECQTGGSTGFVALIQRGTLDFATKVTNAKAQGAAAAVIYNNAAGDFTGTLGAAGSWVPAVSVSDAAGAALEARVGTSTTVVNKVSNWDYYDGTSMATPHTSAIVALIWSANPTMTANNIETTLKNNCDDLGAAGYDTTYGYGRINADRALAATGH